ncbi:MAG: efflux RND transporter periplasmic adaptor subunit [Lachnospiraceae bacterium]|nr:efflux RND transporter periplasmic adaptor subunit [Lachnospiraceae bacterium]
MKNRKVMKMLAISACVMMLSASFTGCAKSTPEATEEVDMSVSVETSKPDIRDISISSNFAATVEADSEVIVMPKVGGEVTAKNFEVGDHVNEGDLLFAIDDESAQIALTQAKATVTSAQAGVTNSEASQQAAQFSAAETIGTIATKEQQLQNAVDSAQANVQIAANTLDTASKGVDYSGKSKSDLKDDLKDAKKDKKKLKNLIDEYYASSDETKRENVLKGSGYSNIAAVESAYAQAKSSINSLEKSIDSGDLSETTNKNSAATAEQNYFMAQESAQLAQQQQQDYQNYTKNTTIAGVTSSLAQAEAGVTSSKASLEQAKASLENAKIALENTQVKSPVSGKITAINVSLHNTVNAGSQAYVIESDANSKIVFYVTEETVRNMSVGNSAIVTKNGEDYQAKITMVSSTLDSDKHLFKVEASVIGASDLVNGSDVTVRTVTRQAKKAISVPVSSVYYDGEQAYVYVNDNGIAKRTDIVTGISDSTNVAVTDGLTADDNIVVSYSSQLTDGVELKVSGNADKAESKEEASK